MFKVVMTGLFDTIYTVHSGMSLSESYEMVEYLINTCKSEYFDDLLVTDVKILDTSNVIVLDRVVGCRA